MMMSSLLRWDCLINFNSLYESTPAVDFYFEWFFFQTLAIDKWNTDSVEEFLDLYLIKEDEEQQP